MKYEGEKDRARFLGAVLAGSDAADLLVKADHVVPVPMFEGKRLDRGYNQVEVMAEVACASLGIGFPSSLLLQPEGRPSQVDLSARERRVNVRGSFALNPAFAVPAGARLALVDDVRTTGATLAACVESLRGLRPRRMDIVTLAAELPGGVMEELGLEP
jgi:predicted amidophosphoribosyltransferase